MNVDFSAADLVAEKVWYDAGTGRLCLSAGAYQNGIPLAQIPDADFESTAPIGSFSLGQNGAVVICHHKDGTETWLPVDLWLPDGFSVGALR
ncbi:MAG: hypothetical protein B9S26_14995 [Opitutia bacterium Tous-C4FEB]|jgi:hypothetical protein|nr:MAG: hypothetical protein B9S35_11975 [Opitutae bacterium Tous-C5TDCM]PAW86892.1 MAG: hypothetical protein B9S26_14995 [Opitutae bacterium Tous-C4FEB]